MLKVLLVVTIVLSSCAAAAEPGVLSISRPDGDSAGLVQSTGGTDVMLNNSLYEIQPQNSRMVFRVDSPIGDVWASFQEFEGVFTMRGSSDNDMAAIEINADSLDASGGIIGLLLKSRNFFDVENFPSMHFVGTALEWYSDRRGVLKGRMTIKGVTRQVAFYVELVDAEEAASGHIKVEAETTIRRSAFGIHSMLPAVSDNVNLFMSIDAVKQRPSLSMR